MKNVVKIDEKNFKITDDSSSSRQEVVFAATKKATPKRAGKAVVITDIYKDSDGLIVIALDELQVDGASYATAANACVALNGFIGLFSGGGGGVSPKIPAGAVSMSDSINAETLVIEDWMTAIPDYMCYKRNFLKKIIGGGNVTSIGVSAFDGCTALADLGDLGKRVTSIGQYAFANCNALTDLGELGKVITSIGSQAFAYCNALKNGNFPIWASPTYDSLKTSLFVSIVIGSTAVNGNLPQFQLFGSSNSTAILSITLGYTNIIGWNTGNPSSSTGCISNLPNLTDIIFTALTVTILATGIGFYNCKQINQASVVNLFNKLVDNTPNTARPLYFSPEVIARLSQTDKDIALNKNYTINACAA